MSYKISEVHKNEHKNEHTSLYSINIHGLSISFQVIKIRATINNEYQRLKRDERVRF